MKSLNGVAVVAAWSALQVGGSAVAQYADCNVNGIPDATEIAQGLEDDCNANGIPDACEYAGVMLEAEQPGFGNGSPLIATFTDVDLSLSDVRLDIAVRADLDSVGEFVQVKVGGSVVATLWVTGGQACPSEVQSQTVLIPAATFNASIVNGTVVVALEPSGVVSVKECPSSFASLAAEYVSDVLPADCLGNGAWDGCAISADPSLDCDGNGLIDSCEIDDAPSLDCDGNGVLDACDLAADPLLDCDANGTLDACDIAIEPNLDCDSNGQIDSCEVSSGTAADCNQNGRPDNCDSDCDGDGVPDDCAVDSGAAADCNGNGVPDTCELRSNSLFIADCDGNGEVDSCQIDADPLLDKNADGLLDSCQYTRGDLDLDRVVGGADLAVLLSLWGTPDATLGDLNNDNSIDGADLAVLLSHWGAYERPWGVVLEVHPDPTVITDPSWRDRIIATGMPWRIQDIGTGIEMLLVPPGTFVMGCSPSEQSGCDSSYFDDYCLCVVLLEYPVHEVTLTKAFYIGRYEVTQAQWTAVMASNPSQFQSASAEVPADQVHHRPVERTTRFCAGDTNCNTIHEFEAQSGLRLPTEAEWEYACRAGTTTAFSNSSNQDSSLSTLAWFNANSGNQTRPVGQRLPNALGLYDMHGNVWEWVADNYERTYYAESPAMDPTGPTGYGSRPGVLRGGGWGDNSGGCRVSSRLVITQNDCLACLAPSRGFRVARTP